MLRIVLGSGRRRRKICDSSSSDADQDMHADGENDEVESWVEWLKRTTQTIEEQLGIMDTEYWVALYRRKKWK